MSPPELLDRRAALKTAFAGVAATLLAPSFLLVQLSREASAVGHAASATRRWGLLIDVSRCQGECSLCVEACSREHGWQVTVRGAVEPQWIRLIEATDETSGRTSLFPLLCQHCTNPPCADVCPTSATFRRADGIVLVDRHRCIGCRYCVMACPFGVRFFLGDAVRDQRSHSPRGKGTAEGCNLCVHRLDQGDVPACVEACASAQKAMIFGDLNDASSPIRRALAEKSATPLRPELALAQSVFYQSL